MTNFEVIVCRETAQQIMALIELARDSAGRGQLPESVRRMATEVALTDSLAHTPSHRLPFSLFGGPVPLDLQEILG